MLTRIIMIGALVVSSSGIGYGLWQGRTAAVQAQEILRLGQVVEQQATALRAAEARAKASASAAKARQKINQEQETARVKDQEAVAKHPDWASQPIPADIAERLLND